MKLLFFTLMFFESMISRANCAVLDDILDNIENASVEYQSTIDKNTLIAEKYKKEELENIKNIFGEEVQDTAADLIKKIPAEQVSIPVLNAVFEGIKKGYITGEKSPRKESPRSSNLKKLEDIFMANTSPPWGIREIRTADAHFDEFIKKQGVDKVDEAFWEQVMEVLSGNIRPLNSNIEKLLETKSSIDMAMNIYKTEIGIYR